ncbi:helix-turn-helix transcriptional regulator [Vibrio neptunius]|uniref:Helix-turn-helix transcriptional regulator n=1 Tax=Vibrio neptunius TaxID=170651 RepID=A0ABS2ZWN9_9VIBR|nr:helix-turn-helix transcriptional regulator [Vibrio neptunius]MBN3514463.1 helix-turn-helix transcriptional regulator [Vibrio neptunius]MBN3548422.1 helix-turn-helix transcriptional regulator [Vibrio neptunius]MBN3576468.1 helix-turn-helix transcriptional regulator [Vibrio neptunius]MCH9870132.1 helix-turn-helix transcriptional regulator [Vibrio neptunius]
MNCIELLKIHHPAASETEWHQHEYAQLYWVSKGIFTIETSDQQWTITPACLGWIPPHLQHRSDVVSDIEAVMIYVPLTWLNACPQQAKVIKSNPLIQALIERMTHFDFSVMTEPQQRQFQVLLDEVHLAPASNLYLPLPKEAKMRQIADSLLETPDDARSQTELAHDFGTSTRTLSRLFKKETGIAFGFWRQQARLISSLPLLEKGLSITCVALSCGYSNTSTFITVFKARFGVTPSVYFGSR